jgi:hypothetical protein
MSEDFPSGISRSTVLFFLGTKTMVAATTGFVAIGSNIKSLLPRDLPTNKGEEARQYMSKKLMLLVSSIPRNIIYILEAQRTFETWS